MPCGFDLIRGGKKCANRFFPEVSQAMNNGRNQKSVLRFNGVFIRTVLVWAVLSIFLCSGGGVCSLLSSKKDELFKTRRTLRKVRTNLKTANRRQKDLSHQLCRTQKQIKTLKSDIHNLNKSINLSFKHIRKLRAELEILRDNYAKKQVCLQNRLRDIYLNDSGSSFLDLMGSRDFSEFVNHSDYLGLICEADQQLIQTLRMEQEAIRFKQDQVNNKYRRMLSHRGRLKQKRHSLESIEKTREDLLQQVEKERRFYQDKKVQLEDHTQELENEVQSLIRSYQSRRPSYSGRSYSTPKCTGDYLWPTPGPVTSNYGYRMHPIFGTWRMHTGIDVGAPYGQGIKAMDGGTVILAGWCGGYGNTVIVDHGRGLSTLYAHCSSVYVSYGQTVAKGQVVGAVGSTGYSTGPHLHFEFRQNGVPVSPWGYLR